MESLFFSDACNPLVYRVLDDHRRSISYRSSNPRQQEAGSSQISSANRYQVSSQRYQVSSPDEDYDQIEISLVDQELLCDDVLPDGWYRFLTYGM